MVQDGAIYLTGGANVFAFDARTGEPIWHWQPDPDAGRVVSWQGVVVADDVVVFGTRSGEVLALRRDTGELVWATRVGSPEQTRGEVVTTAPMYARGKVFVGLANGDIGGQGRVLALDAATGEVAWTFFVVPRPGEFGHETWPQDNDSWEFGGGGVWLVGTVDPDLGMVYFSTGNPVPMFGGELREGDNLFTAAVLALDMETGERRWHYQVVRHDVWDADIATPLLLYDTTVDGEPVKAVAAMRADGYLFLFNRETGEPLLPDRGARGAAGRAPAHGADPAVPGADRDHPLPSARTGATGCRRRSSSVAAATRPRRSTSRRWWRRGCRYRGCGSRRWRSRRRPATSTRRGVRTSAAPAASWIRSSGTRPSST